MAAADSLQLLFCGEGRNFPALENKQRRLQPCLINSPRFHVCWCQSSTTAGQLCSSDFPRLKMEAETLSKQTCCASLFWSPGAGRALPPPPLPSAAGGTRAADMTALTNKRTGRDAHRCTLRRTQTAQYEAISLPVPPRSLQAYSTPPPALQPHPHPLHFTLPHTQTAPRPSGKALASYTWTESLWCDLLKEEQMKRNDAWNLNVAQIKQTTIRTFPP